MPLRALLLAAALLLVLLHKAAPGLLLVLRSDGLGHGESDSVLLRIVRSLLGLSRHWARQARCARSAVTFLTCPHFTPPLWGRSADRCVTFHDRQQPRPPVDRSSSPTDDKPGSGIGAIKNEGIASLEGLSTHCNQPRPSGSSHCSERRRTDHQRSIRTQSHQSSATGSIARRRTSRL